MKPLYLLAASGLALTAIACSPKAPPARAALECPPKQGDLTRTSAATDGKACSYVTSGGDEVTLQLISTTGGADAALSVIETTLLANRQAKSPEAVAGDAGAKPEDPQPKAAPDKTDPQADTAVKEALEDTKQAGVSVKIDKTGKHVVHGDDGTTRIDLPGIHIVANERDETANVRLGPITVKAGDGAATIRLRRDVRLRGQAFSREKRGLRATFIYTGEDLPQGYRFVGYEAGGPKTGPITVAVVKSRSDGDDGGEIYPDVKKLVRKNGGV